MASVYQIYVQLQDLEPAIWRRILVPSDIELAEMHKVLQVVMGWSNSHLHQFLLKGKYYSPRTDGDEDFWDESMNVDYQNIKLDDLLQKPLDVLEYEYDYGDSWMHNLVLEDILPKESTFHHPRCLDGERHCPAEDCGGIGGYEELLKTLKKPKSAACKEWREWLGDDFNPDHFDLAEVNDALQLPDYGLPEWEGTI